MFTRRRRAPQTLLAACPLFPMQSLFVLLTPLSPPFSEPRYGYRSSPVTPPSSSPDPARTHNLAAPKPAASGIPSAGVPAGWHRGGDVSHICSIVSEKSITNIQEECRFPERSLILHNNPLLPAMTWPR